MNLQGSRVVVVLLWSLLASTALAEGRAGYGFVSSEFQSVEEIRSALPTLASRKVGLVLDWPSSELHASDRLELVRAAQKLGVEVHPWLLLPQEAGLWANATNADLYVEAARELLEAWLAAGLAPTTLVVDMEMPVERARQLAAVITGGGSVSDVANFLRGFIDRAQYARATTLYRSFVDHAHARGFKVEVSAWTQVLDDYGDGDDGLRQSFSVPLDGIAWDTVSFQAYRTLNTALTSASAPPTTSYYVLDYGLRARARFGTRAGLGVGMTDSGDLAPALAVYTSGAQLREDVDAATLAGIPRAKLGVYNLRGMLSRPPVAQWFPAASLIILPPLPDLATLITRLNSAQLDAAL